MRQVPYSTCTGCGKRGYYSRHDARTIRRRLGGDGLTVYVCHISGAWHLGHPQPGKSRDDYRKERL